MKKSDRGKKVWSLIVFFVVMVIVSLFIGAVSAEEAEGIIIDTEKGVPGFWTEPARDLPSNWRYVQDHPDSSADGWFDTNAYPPGQGNGSFWYTISFPEMSECKGIWMASLPHSGEYEVFAWIPSPDPFDPYLDESTPPSDYLPTKRAEYKVFHNSGVATVTIDQNVNKGGFRSLGVFEFDTTARVELSSSGIEFWRSVAFDAVEFVPVEFNRTINESESILIIPSEPTSFQTHLETLVDTEEWSEDIRITNDPAGSYRPKIAADSNNNVHIVWGDGRNGNYDDIYYTKLDNMGNTIIDDMRLTSGVTRSFNPSIAIDSSNNVHITWLSSEIDAPVEMYYTKLDNDGNTLVDKKILTTLTPYGIDPIIIGYPHIAIDSNDNIHVVWEDGRNPKTELYYMKLDNNGNKLVSDKRLTYDTELSWHQDIVIDSNDNIHIAWVDYRYGLKEIYYTKLDNNGNTLVDDKRETDNSEDPWGLTSSIDSNDNIHITWSDKGYEAYNTEIFYTKLDNNGNTLVDKLQLTQDPAISSSPVIAVDSKNNIHIVWADGRDGLFYEIYYTKLDNNGNTLEDDLRLTYSDEYSACPDIAVDSNDNVHITWHDYRDGNWEIYYKTKTESLPLEDWPMFRRDPAHTGCSPDRILNFVPAWRFKTGDIVRSSPAVANGKVFVGSHDGKIYALDETTGGMKWEHNTGNIVVSSPAVGYGKVFVGSYNRILYAFNEDNGDVDWTSGSDGYIFSSPVVANGRVFVGTSINDQVGELRALWASDGTNAWQAPFYAEGPIYSSPAVTNGKVFFGCNNYPSPTGTIYCLDASKGEEKWHFNTNGGVVSSPAVVNGKVFVGCNDHKIYALHEEDINGDKIGDVIWSYDTGRGGYVSSSPAVADGKVFIGCCDGWVYCLHEEDEGANQLIWEAKIGTGNDLSCKQFSSPAFADDLILVGSDNNKIYAIIKGGIWAIWVYTTGGPVSSSPAVANGKVFVSSEDHYIYAFGKGTTDIAAVRDRLWYVDTNCDRLADLFFNYGLPGDTFIVGDVDQNGLDDIAAIRGRLWYVDTSRVVFANLGPGCDYIADQFFNYGLPGDTFIVGDVNQDDKDDTAAIRGRTWYVDTNGDHIADLFFRYGLSGDSFIVGDINQDGKDDIAAVRGRTWYVDTNGDHIADLFFNYGLPGDVFLVGDVKRDGEDDIAAIRGRTWYVDTNGDYIADLFFNYGLPGDVFLIGDID